MTCFVSTIDIKVGGGKEVSWGRKESTVAGLKNNNKDSTRMDQPQSQCGTIILLIRGKCLKCLGLVNVGQLMHFEGPRIVK